MNPSNKKWDSASLERLTFVLGLLLQDEWEMAARQLRARNCNPDLCLRGECCDTNMVLIRNPFPDRLVYVGRLPVSSEYIEIDADLAERLLAISTTCEVAGKPSQQGRKADALCG